MYDCKEFVDPQCHVYTLLHGIFIMVTTRIHVKYTNDFLMIYFSLPANLPAFRPAVTLNPTKAGMWAQPPGGNEYAARSCVTTAM